MYKLYYFLIIPFFIFCQQEEINFDFGCEEGSYVNCPSIRTIGWSKDGWVAFIYDSGDGSEKDFRILNTKDNGYIHASYYDLGPKDVKYYLDKYNITSDGLGPFYKKKYINEYRIKVFQQENIDKCGSNFSIKDYNVLIGNKNIGYKSISSGSKGCVAGYTFKGYFKSPYENKALIVLSYTPEVVEWENNYLVFIGCTFDSDHFLNVIEDYYSNGQIKEKKEIKWGHSMKVKKYMETGYLSYEYNAKYSLEKYDKNIFDLDKYVMHGLYKTYNADGEVIEEINFKSGKRHGKYQAFEDGSMLKESGNYKNDQKDGEWIGYFDKGNVKHKINYKNGKQNGLEISYQINGEVISEANYLNDKLHGMCQQWYKDGTTLQYQKNYNNGLENGICKTWFENGNLEFDGSYVEGKMDGVCKSWNSYGLEYERVYDKGEINSALELSYYDNGQKKTEDNYLHNRSHGVSKGWYENGTQKYEYNYDDDWKHGVYKTWFENGDLEFDGSYLKNLLNGVCKSWNSYGLVYERVYDKGKITSGLELSYYDNGQKKGEDNYLNNKLHGVSKGWHENGTQKHEHNYHNGLENGVYKTWFENGAIQLNFNYLEGKFHGLCKTGYYNGQKESKEEYENGVLNGVRKEWYKNSQLKFQGNYILGNPDGVLEEFYENSNIKSKTKYKNGDFKSKKCWGEGGKKIGCK